MSVAYITIRKEFKEILMIYTRLVIEGNAVYEIDDECLKKREERNRGKSSEKGNRPSRPSKGK